MNRMAAELQWHQPDPQPGNTVYLPGNGLVSADRMRGPHMGHNMVDYESWVWGLGQNMMDPSKSFRPSTVFKTPKTVDLYPTPLTVSSPPVRVCFNNPLTAPMYK